MAKTYTHLLLKWEAKLGEKQTKKAEANLFLCKLGTVRITYIMKGTG